MPSGAKGLRTEAALLNAAREVFADKGYFNTKISDIAEVAGRSPGSFYNYYENKEQLLEALLDQFSAKVLEKSLKAASDDPRESIRGAVRAYWTSYREYLPEMIGVFHMSMLDERFAARWRENRAAGIRAVLAGLRGAERSGHPTGLQLDVLASVIVSMLEGFCWTWLAAGGDPDVARPDDETVVDTLAAVWYRAVFGGDPASE